MKPLTGTICQWSQDEQSEHRSPVLSTCQQCISADTTTMAAMTSCPQHAQNPSNTQRPSRLGRQSDDTRPTGASMRRSGSSHLRTAAGRIKGPVALLLPAGALQVVEAVAPRAGHWAGRRHGVALHRHPQPPPVRVQRLCHRRNEMLCALIVAELRTLPPRTHRAGLTSHACTETTLPNLVAPSP